MTTSSSKAKATSPLAAGAPGSVPAATEPLNLTESGLAPTLTSYGRPLLGRFERVGEVMSALGTVWIFALLVLINADVIGRDLFSKPIPGVPEMLGLSIVGIVYLQLPNTLWSGRFTRAEFMSDVIDRRWPRAGAAVRALYHLLGLALIGILFFALLPEFQSAWTMGDYVGAIGVFTAPTWPVRLIMLIGCAATAITYLLLLIIDLRDFSNPAVANTGPALMPAAGSTP